MNPLIKGLFLSVIIILSNNFILNSLYTMYAEHNSYLAITHNYSYLFKYFFLGAVFAFIFLVYGSVEGAGKFFLILFQIISIVGALGSLVWYDAATTDKIVQQRLWGKTVYTWDNLKVVKTQARIDYANSDNHEDKKIILEYNLCFTDSTYINMWNKDINVLYELDSYLKTKQVIFSHEYISRDVKNNLGDYANGDTETLKEILGIHE